MICLFCVLPQLHCSCVYPLAVVVAFYCYSLIVMCMCNRSCLDSEIHRIRKCICILCMIHRCHRYSVIPRRQCAGPVCSIHSILNLRRIGFSCFIHIYIIISGIACCIPGKRCGLIRFSRIHAHIWLARYTNARIDKAKQHLVGIIRRLPPTALVSVYPYATP